MLISIIITIFISAFLTLQLDERFHLRCGGLIFCFIGFCLVLIMPLSIAITYIMSLF